MSDLFDRISDNNEIERLRRERAEQDWRSAVERLIDEAQKDGAFDNLPGKGRPLKLKKNPYAPDHALAYDLLQNNNYTLPWIADRNEVLEKIAAWRETLRQRWLRQRARRQGTPDPDREALLRRDWMETVQGLGEDLRILNKEIADVNLIVPVDRLEILKLDLATELERIGASDR